MEFINPLESGSTHHQGLLPFSQNYVAILSRKKSRLMNVRQDGSKNWLEHISWLPTWNLKGQQWREIEREWLSED